MTAPSDGQVGDDYTCAQCGETFTRMRSDADAWVEAEERHGAAELSKPGTAVVCDDCFKKVTARCRVCNHDRPTHRASPCYCRCEDDPSYYTVTDGKHTDAIEATVAGCVRCGETHTNVVWRLFTKPPPDYTHWFPCPTNGEPILMRLVDTP